jgi:DNA transformation protein and related proteins
MDEMHTVFAAVSRGCCSHERAIPQVPSCWVGLGGVFRFMTVSSDFLSYVTGQLACLGEIHTRSLFGGMGILVENRLVAVILDDQLYLHTDENNRSDYTARGMGPFRPYPNAFNLTTDQYQVPADIVNTPEQLQQWGRRALQASIASARAKQLAGIERSRKAKSNKKKST